jgi:hypothetical protein
MEGIRQDSPYYNLGVARGVLGPIALLGRACALPAARAQVEPALERAVAWLLSHKLPRGSASVFPRCIENGSLRPERTCSWCFGDAGMAAALLVAARAVGEPHWEQEALSVARHVAEIPFEQTRLRSAFLCHGTVGLAHIFNRFFQATGESIFHDAAVAYYQRTIDLLAMPGGMEGSLRPGPNQIIDGPGLLRGAAGVGLALLAAVMEIEPAWDRALLLSPL